MTILGLDHVQVAIPPGSDEVARAFYAGVLGLEEIPKPEPLRATGALWLRVGGSELHLGIQRDFHPARKAHPGIRVADADEIAARCSAAGHPVEWDDRYPGVRRFYVHDPFGNRIEIMQVEG